MRTKQWVLVVLLGLLPTGTVYARRPSADQPLPKYQVGITGLYVRPQRGAPHVVVDSVEPGTPAAARFMAGDVIVAPTARRSARPTRVSNWVTPSPKPKPRPAS